MNVVSSLWPEIIRQRRRSTSLDVRQSHQNIEAVCNTISRVPIEVVQHWKRNVAPSPTRPAWLHFKWLKISRFWDRQRTEERSAGKMLTVGEIIKSCILGEYFFRLWDRQRKESNLQALFDGSLSLWQVRFFSRSSTTSHSIQTPSEMGFFVRLVVFSAN